MEEIRQEKSGGMKKTSIAILIVVILVAIAYMVFFRSKTNLVVDSSKYQAVFVSNGQVYFGKVSGEKKDYVSVSDVYYMVLKQPLQNQKAEGTEQDQTKPEYTLVKLGKEMHGPTSMSINKDQILFIENLSDDSKVVSTIKNSAK